MHITLAVEWDKKQQNQQLYLNVTIILQHFKVLIGEQCTPICVVVYCQLGCTEIISCFDII